MKFKSIEDKLKLYYDKLEHPSKIIGNWNIVDVDAFDKLKKYKITGINIITKYPAEKILSLEAKNNYIIIKYSLNFIASKITNREYDYHIQDWDLIAVDKVYLYKGTPSPILSNKQLVKLLELSLTNKAKKDLDYFD